MRQWTGWVLLGALALGCDGDDSEKQQGCSAKDDCAPEAGPDDGIDDGIDDGASDDGATDEDDVTHDDATDEDDVTHDDATNDEDDVTDDEAVTIDDLVDDEAVTIDDLVDDEAVTIDDLVDDEAVTIDDDTQVQDEGPDAGGRDADDAASGDPNDDDPTDDGTPVRDAAANDEPANDDTTQAVDDEEQDETDGGVTVIPPIEPPDDPAPEFAGPPEKVDLLFVVDNSRSMADKQRLLSEALPDLIERLLSPYCRHPDGVTEPADEAGNCAEPAVREFTPITDLHVGVITTSLGGYGAVRDCTASDSEDSSEQNVDMARLLGSLPRGAAAAPSAADSGFLSWTTGAAEAELIGEFADLVATAGEFGCGWEASLESWVRFLVDPYPHTRVVRQACNSNDTQSLCSGPETDPNGNLLVDATILQQRAAFLRPDSLLSIVMFTDENDCSFKPHAQSWRLSQTVNADGGFNAAFRATAACDDPAFGPNHECCHSCGQAAAPPAVCPSVVNEEGQTVGVGCEESRRYGLDGLEDAVNLRCYQQKRRFGVDFLMPLERYTHALEREHICALTNELDAQDCSTVVVRNPLFRVVEGARRPRDWLYLVGILGVPWQDLAEDPDGGEPLRYRSADPESSTPIDWSWVIGPEQTSSGYPEPANPLMLEQVAPRSGVVPSTGEALAAPNAARLANSINGHEWQIQEANDLQYACIFPLAAPVECPTLEEYSNLRDLGVAVPSCDCTDFAGDAYANPVCQAPDGSYGVTQYFGKAYPSLRQLRVLERHGKNSIVGSICPKEQSTQQSDYGYRPAVAAMLERFSEVLAPR